MTRHRKPTNIAASVQARLLNVARDRSEDFQLVLTSYGLERLLYRLGQSPHRKDFVLKGAMLFRVWSDEPHRPTRDLDLLGRGTNSADRYKSVFCEIAEQPVEDDGLTFEIDTIRVQQIREGQEYNGLRLQFNARLANIRIPIQIDLGIGDAVTPGPIEIEFPTLLDLPPPRLLSYPRETVVAEKFHAIVMLGMANTRMKDFFDLWILSQDYDFDGVTLSEAIRVTFERRGTEIPTQTPIALSLEFSDDPRKQSQWNAFLKKGKLSIGAQDFRGVIERLRGFLIAPMQALQDGGQFAAVWTAGGGWAKRA